MMDWWLAGCGCISGMKWNRSALQSELYANQICVSPQEGLFCFIPQGQKHVGMREELCLNTLSI